MNEHSDIFKNSKYFTSDIWYWINECFSDDKLLKGSLEELS